MQIKLVKRETPKKKILEADIQAPAMQWLKKQSDIECWKASDQYTRGVSDIIICLSGLFIAIELKIPGKLPTPLQHGFIEKINNINGLAFFCDSVEGVKNAIEYVREHYCAVIKDVAVARKYVTVSDDRLVVDGKKI